MPQRHFPFARSSTTTYLFFVRCLLHLWQYATTASISTIQVCSCKTYHDTRPSMLWPRNYCTLYKCGVGFRQVRLANYSLSIRLLSTVQYNVTFRVPRCEAFNRVQRVFQLLTSGIIILVDAFYFISSLFYKSNTSIILTTNSLEFFYERAFSRRHFEFLMRYCESYL